MPFPTLSSPLPRRSTSVVIVLTLSIGMGAAVAVFGVAEASLSGTLECPAPLSCSAAAAVDHLPPATRDRGLAQAAITSGFRTLVRVAIALTAVLLGLAGLNVATSALTGTAAKRTDTALRAALGAAPVRLLLARLTHTTRIAVPAVVLGGGLGLLARWLLSASWPGAGVPWGRTGWLPLGALIAGAALVVILFVTLCWPAALAWSRNLRSHLGGARHSTPGPVDALVKDSLAVVQAGASLMLIVTAGLLVLAFTGQNASAPGGAQFEDGQQTLLVGIELPTGSEGSADLSARGQRYQELLERVRGLPGVVDTSLASEGAWLGLGVTERVTSLCLECWLGLLPKVQTTGPARIHTVGPDYFRPVGLGILRGRGIDDRDDGAAERVAVISRALALRFFPNGDPLGKEIRLGGLGGPWVRVVGVAEDLEAEGLATRSQPHPALYLSILQSPPAAATLVAMTEDAPPTLETEIERTAEALIPAGRVMERGTLAEAQASYREPLRWFGRLYVALAFATLVCACSGLYALMSAQVRLRAREIGIRMSVGADARRIIRMVMTKTLRLVALGSILGLIPLSGVARLLQLRFEGIDPWDPALVLSAAGLLLFIALLASYRPARNAARLDPVVGLRDG